MIESAGTLRALWSVPAGVGAGSVELLIDGADLPEESFLPNWAGAASITSLSDEGASGSLTFTGLELEVDAGSKPGLPAPGGAEEWLATLSGTVTWSCEPWSSPTSSETPSSSPAP